MRRRAGGPRSAALRCPISSETDIPNQPGAAGSDARRAKNETFFRESNELIERDAARNHSQEFDCICECSSRGCLQRLDLQRSEYEAVRRYASRFVVAPGHEDPRLETVVERHPHYFVVEKHGLAGAIAEARDPRQ